MGPVPLTSAKRCVLQPAAAHPGVTVCIWNGVPFRQSMVYLDAVRRKPYQKYQTACLMVLLNPLNSI